MTLTLSPTQMRAVAALVEKSIATPQNYPLTLNGLTAACNQKSSRHPVMNLSEAEVGGALNELEALRMIKREDQGSRVPKWRHRFHHELLIKEAPMAVLVVLMLRGPQTLSEIRSRAVSLGEPDDSQAILDILSDLADRAQPLVSALSRQPGQSAQRYTQMICAQAIDGAETMPVDQVGEQVVPTATAATPGLAARVEALEARVAELEAKLAPLLS